MSHAEHGLFGREACVQRNVIVTGMSEERMLRRGDVVAEVGGGGKVVVKWRRQGVRPWPW